MRKVAGPLSFVRGHIPECLMAMGLVVVGLVIANILVQTSIGIKLIESGNTSGNFPAYLWMLNVPWGVPAMGAVAIGGCAMFFVGGMWAIRKHFNNRRRERKVSNGTPGDQPSHPESENPA